MLGLAGVLSDVSVERRSQRRLRQLIDGTLPVVGLCRPDGTLKEVNRSILDLTRLDPAEAIGRKLWETTWWAWNDTVAEQLRDAVEHAGTGRASRYDVEVMGADGLKTLDFQLSPIVEDGEVVALVASGTNVSAQHRSVDEAAGTARLVALLNSAMSETEVADTIREHSQDAVGDWATLALIADEGGGVRLFQSPDLPAAAAQEYRRLPLDSPNPIARCIRDRATIVTADPLTPDDVDGSAAELERLRKARAEAGVRLSAATPLIASDGSVFGAVALSWPDAAALDVERHSRLRTLAELCGQAIERARLTDARATQARRSQALAGSPRNLPRRSARTRSGRPSVGWARRSSTPPR